MKNTNFILLTIDVEDYFQVENFKQWIPFSSWSSYELRVEKNTHCLLDLLDSVACRRNCCTPPKATFFILAWIAKRLPNLIREINRRGHEVASHGCNHQLCNKQPVKELTKDLIDSKNFLEDIVGESVIGYRAPSFVINEEVLKIIQQCGYLYDSSYNCFDMHERYGKVDLSCNKKKRIAVEISDNFYELPISNFKIGKQVVPLGGGGYFRMIPFPIFKAGIKKILRKDKDYLFYMHPWEIDCEQPRIKQASLSYKFRHYINLATTHSKLSKLLTSFDKQCFVTCKQYLNRQIPFGNFTC